MWRVVALAAAICAIQALSTGITLAGQRQELSGIVTDALQAPLSGVDLLLQRVNGHIVARSTSDRAGHFHFVNIPPGTYAVVANKTGFATAASMVVVSPDGAERLVISMAAQGALNREAGAKHLQPVREGAPADPAAPFNLLSMALTGSQARAARCGRVIINGGIG